MKITQLSLFDDVPAEEYDTAEGTTIQLSERELAIVAELDKK
jgi:hypothetical protein